MATPRRKRSHYEREKMPKVDSLRITCCSTKDGRKYVNKVNGIVIQFCAGQI